MLFAGDVLATLDPLRRKGDPRPLPIPDALTETLRSLERLETAGVRTLAGHGEPSNSGAAEAGRIARASS